MKDNVPAHGTYLLLLECKEKAGLSIGKLGEMVAQPGYYVYVGSAYGPGGIRARVRHHRNVATKPHWHIDYLRAVAEVLDAWCVYDSRCEHEWAQNLMQGEAASMPLQGFGSSDCDCATHLFYFKHRPVKVKLEKLLKNKLVMLGDALE